MTDQPLNNSTRTPPYNIAGYLELGFNPFGGVEDVSRVEDKETEDEEGEAVSAALVQSVKLFIAITHTIVCTLEISYEISVKNLLG